MDALSSQSHRTQLILTAVSACVVTSTLFTAYNAYRQRERRRDLNQDVLRSITASTHKPPTPHELPVTTEADEEEEETFIRPNHIGGYNEDLVKEQLARNYSFFGDESMARVRAGSVVVVGCGGVGSWVAVMLVRSYVQGGDVPVLDLRHAKKSVFNNFFSVAGSRGYGSSISTM